MTGQEVAQQKLSELLDALISRGALIEWHKGAQDYYADTVSLVNALQLPRRDRDMWLP